MFEQARSGPHLMLAAAVVLCAAALAPRALAAQRPGRPAETDSLRVEVRRLRAQLDSLRVLVARLEAARADADTVPAADEDPLAAIRAAAAAAAGAVPDPVLAPPPTAAIRAASRTRNLSALNPEISVNADVFGLSRSDQLEDDNFIAREFEISFQSNLDPYSRAKIYLAHETPGTELPPFPEEGEEEGEIEIEEGYAEYVNLPGGLGVMVGKFRQRVGTLNRWHKHALPGQQLPLPEFAFLGEEGLAQPGASVHWLVPLRGLGTYEVWGEVARADNEVMFGESRRLTALGHLNAFWQFSPAAYFEVGLTGVTGGRSASPEVETGNLGARLYGVDFNFNWRPPAQGLYRDATLRGALYLNRRGLPEGGWSDARGGYLMGEYKFAQRWLVGARFEAVENPEDPDERATLFAPTVTWWQSEFVRLRAEYDFLRRPGNDVRQLLIQMTFAMGPHKHETY